MIKYIGIICIVLLYIGIHAGLNYTAQKSGDDYYQQRITENKTTPKVFDIMHKYLPHWKNYEGLDNIMLLLTILPMIYMNDPNLYYDFAVLLVIINMIRDITINITILPKDNECKFINDNELYNALLGGCYDKIFSGHFAFVFILSLLYNSYNIITNVPLLIGWNIINSLIILLIRSHYTVDLVVSFFVCITIFNEYMKNHFTLEETLKFVE
jgi:hypothetical protein